MTLLRRSKSTGESPMPDDRDEINATLLDRVDGPFEPFPGNWVEDTIERAKQRAAIPPRDKMSASSWPMM